LVLSIRLFCWRVSQQRDCPDEIAFMSINFRFRRLKTNLKLASISVTLIFSAFPGFAQPFVPACKVRFQSIAQPHPIDETCGNEGVGTGAIAAQNIVKNDFCAPDPPVPLKFVDFDALQQSVAEKEISFGSARLPTNRVPLRDMVNVGPSKAVGEGSFVRLAAFIASARNADVATGESVNCRLAGAENNDIHVNLVENQTDDLCFSVTAEISPHLRPVQWTQLSQMQTNRPVRISGQLFFDASHRPCEQGRSGPHPRRRSTWEIHPVYAIDICNYDTLNKCAADDDKAWKALDEWKNEDSSPSKLGITISPSVVHPKQDVKIQISLLNSANEPAVLKQDITIALGVNSVNTEYRDHRSLRVPAGQAWSVVILQLPSAGIYSLTAETPQMRPSNMFLSVVRSNGALNPLPTGTLLNASLRLPTADTHAPVLIQNPQRQQVLILISPSREVMADGVDAASVSALTVGNAARADIAISLHSSLGFFDCPSQDKPNPCADYHLVLPKGFTQVQARLISTQTGASRIDAVPGTPNVDLTMPSATIQFGPPITKIAIEASPPDITLVGRCQLIVHLADDRGMIYVPSHPRKISMSIKKGEGHFDPEDNAVTLKPPDHSAGILFFPGFGIGETELTASTDQLPTITLHVRVRPPIALLLISALGGLVGGAIFISVHRGSSRSRIVIGAVTGFILYWGVVFGIIATKTSFPAVNPLSDFAISVIGGWLGTEVFSLLLKQLGMNAQPGREP
jgi:hypothetical protein